jgi:hypothetical protein
MAENYNRRNHLSGIGSGKDQLCIESLERRMCLAPLNSSIDIGFDQ